MACPICDQKPMNCDCTETEKRQWSEIEDLRLTDAEREAVSRAATFMRKWGGAPNNTDANTLLLMLARLRY